MTGPRILRVSLALALAAGTLLIGIPAWSQSNVGSISGNVTDSSGAAVPNCAVTATSAQTGLKQTVRTRETGFYTFPILPIGTYSLVAEKQGFRNSEHSGVVLDAASRRNVDLVLELGAVTESVTISAAVEQVQTSSGDVARVISEQQLNQIALNGRNYTQLLQLLPGAVTNTLDPFGVGTSAGGQAINGIRTNSILLNFDGAENMDNGGNSNSAIVPNADAIAEVKILTASYSAEFGGRSGALVWVVTRSGTREFHGTTFEFVRNDRFDARSFFAKKVDPLRFNDFGWTLGGPIFIPKRWNTDRSKAFFFYSHEWRYSHVGAVRLNTVPTAEERSGDFRRSSLAAPIDPLNGQPFPDRVVPQTRWSRNGPALLKPYPQPNFPGPGGNYSATGVSKEDPRELILKFDYVLSPNTQLTYRWAHDEIPIWNAWQGSDLGIVPGGRPRPAYVTSANLTHTFSPTMLNVFAFNLTHDIIYGFPQNDVMSRSTLGLNFPEIFPTNRFRVGPNVSLTGFASYNAGDRIYKVNTIFQWRDDFSKVIGSHALKMGFQITRTRCDENTRLNDQGAVTFNVSARNTTRNVVADALLGNFQNYTEVFDDTYYFGRWNQFDFYAQDSWKVNRRLSLEFGLRYNFLPQFYSSLGNTSSFLPWLYQPSRAPRIDPSDGAIVPNTGDLYNGIGIWGSGFPEPAKGRIAQYGDSSLQRLFVGLPRAGRYNNYGDWGPRFGFAYDPFGRGKTSIRGGFGIFYDRISTNNMMAPTGNPPFNNEASIFDGNIDNPAGGTAKTFPANITTWFDRMVDPSVISYNFGVQQELPRRLILDASYVGNVGRHLQRTLNINQLPLGTRLSPPASTTNVNALRPYLGYSTITFRDDADNSNYNSLQVTLNRRLQRGLSFTVNYTLSRTLDYGAAAQNSYNASPDYGLSNIHRKHVFNMNYIYELPFFRQSANAPLKFILGGWELAGVTRAQSGATNSVSVPVDVPAIGGSSSRASVAGNPNLSGSERTLARWFNTEAFLPPEKMTPGKFGDSGRGILIGPGFSLWDLSLLKNFPIRDRARVQFRAECFNFLNHPSFTGINTTVRFDSAGRPTQSYGAVTGAGPGRVIEFGLKLIY